MHLTYVAEKPAERESPKLYMHGRGGLTLNPSKAPAGPFSLQMLTSCHRVFWRGDLLSSQARMLISLQNEVSLSIRQGRVS